MYKRQTYQTKDFYFGRTLDYEFSYGDEIVVTPRKFPLDFCHMGKCDAHYGMIGMAHVANGYPLYYDAVNEKGVGMAGLNFVGNAVYQKVEEGRENVAQYELIPWVLGQCANLQAVSYTHLDVYKRQHCDSVCKNACRRV